jgi:hypothetical protein
MRGGCVVRHASISSSCNSQSGTLAESSADIGVSSKSKQ